MHDDERYGSKQVTVAEAIARLAKLGHVEFDQVKEVEAAKLGCTPSALKKEWEAARRRIRSESMELFAPIEPWDEPVDGDALLDEIVTSILRHVVLQTGAADAVALWILHAHAHDTADISPILTFKSPLEECGKSTALTGLVAPMVPRALTGSNITSSVVFRAIEKWRPTLILDEADTYVRNNEELRGVLDSGHSRRTAYVLRNVGEGTNMEPQCFSTWAPKAVGLIGDMPRTLTSRSITLPMRRMTMTDTIEPIPVDGLDLSDIRSRAARWARDSANALRVARPDMPASLVGRRADNWKHLLAIADLAGGEWPARARNAAEILSARSSSSAAGIMLLEDIKVIFDDTKYSDLPDERAIFSKDLVEQLIKLEERPWSAFGKRGKEITQAQVAKMLGDFEINSGTVRIGSQTAKGYYLKNFLDAFARYLFSDYPRRACQKRHSVTENRKLRKIGCSKRHTHPGCDAWKRPKSHRKSGL